MSLLEIEGLSHSFGDHVLYKNAGFTLNKGEHVGIVGANGTGKSTFIKICTGQIIPDSGRLVWQPDVAIGYLDQYAEIRPDLTMKEFLQSAFSKLYEMSGVWKLLPDIRRNWKHAIFIPSIRQSSVSSMD